MSATTATAEPEPMEPDATEESAEPHEQAEEGGEDSTYDFPMPGGLRGLV